MEAFFRFGAAPLTPALYTIYRKRNGRSRLRAGEVEETFERFQSTPLTLATHVGGRVSHLNNEMFQGMASRNDASGTAGVMGRGIERGAYVTAMRCITNQERWSMIDMYIMFNILRNKW